MISSFRRLNPQEAKNERILAQRVTCYSLLFVTNTGLKKATFDATESVRLMFNKTGFHKYEAQGRGRAEHGRNGRALFLTEEGETERPVSLFKPKAKPRQSGDPRFWPYGAGNFASGGEVFALFVNCEKLCIINISREKLNELINIPAFGFIDKFLKECEEESLSLANELVQKLRSFASRGPLSSPSNDEGVGFAVEEALGLARNHRGIPDYKGKIEIKAGRGRSDTSMLSVKPDWDLAKNLNSVKSPVDRYCTSPKEFLHRYGYWRDNDWKIYCDVNTQRYNKQHLKLHLNVDDGLLIEKSHRKPCNVVVWKIDELHKRLEEKHPETMFIKARSVNISTKVKHFFLETAVYCRTPSFSKFDQLLADGTIKVCHRVESGKDHGIAFRIPALKVSQLFLAQPRIFDLTEPP